MAEQDPRGLSRREALKRLSAVLAAGPLGSVLGCGGTVGAMADAASASDAAVGVDAATSLELDAAAGAADAVASGAWASGGTAAMTDLATYPDPFTAIPDVSCVPTCAMTLGPCHDDLAPAREDVSEGQRGLPMRLGLRIVDESCQPVTDANVDIWHCDVVGVYSSETADNPPFCTGSNAEALAARWFRGHQMTDARGVAWFSSCFPGWYRGRAIHIHLTVRRSTREGDEYVTTQIAFDEALIREICTTHADYAPNGVPDTANTADSVFPSATVEEYAVETMRMTDGAMLAWKTIVIRSALSNEVCSAGGMMGPPPGG